MNLAEQSAQWLRELETRKRQPVHRSTLATYQSGLKTWILPRLGAVELADLKNGALKRFVSELSAAGLSPASINLWTNTVKVIVGSARDADGEPLYPRDWNNEFLDLPVLEPGSQKQPYIDARTAQKAIFEADAPYGALFAILAGTGLRIAEALAIRVGMNKNHTMYWPGDRAIRVRTQRQGKFETPPKTAAGVRDVDLSEKLNAFLTKRAMNVEPGTHLFKNIFGGRMHLTTARRHLNKAGIEGFHCFRRYRLTWLRAHSVPEDIIKFWMGHGAQNITDRYSKLSKEIDLRRKWADDVGLGFKLPED